VARTWLVASAALLPFSCSNTEPSPVPDLAGDYRLVVSTSVCPGFFPFSSLSFDARAMQQGSKLMVEVIPTRPVSSSGRITGRVEPDDVVFDEMAYRESAGAYSLSFSAATPFRARRSGRVLSGNTMTSVEFWPGGPIPEGFACRFPLPITLTPR
jgi:hypothetical protein